MAIFNWEGELEDNAIARPPMRLGDVGDQAKPSDWEKYPRTMRCRLQSFWVTDCPKQKEDTVDANNVACLRC